MFQGALVNHLLKSISQKIMNLHRTPNDRPRQFRIFVIVLNQPKKSCSSQKSQKSKLKNHVHQTNPKNHSSDKWSLTHHCLQSLPSHINKNFRSWIGELVGYITQTNSNAEHGRHGS